MEEGTYFQRDPLAHVEYLINEKTEERAALLAEIAALNSVRSFLVQNKRPVPGTEPSTEPTAKP